MVFFCISLVAFFYFYWKLVLIVGLPRIYAIFYWKYLILICSLSFFLLSLFPGLRRQSIMMLLVMSNKNSMVSSSPERDVYLPIKVVSPVMIAPIHLSSSYFCLFSVYSSHISKLYLRFFFFLLS